jgi:hypothetical protein
MADEYTGPTQANFITQIEADLKTDGGESDTTLKERLKLVKAAKTDEAASKAYFGHLADVQAAPAGTLPAPNEGAGNG